MRNYRTSYIRFTNSAPRMENHMENNMRNEMDTGIMQWFIGIMVIQKLGIPFWEAS